MTDLVLKSRNPHKILTLRAGKGDNGIGADWVTALAASRGIKAADYFAPGLESLLGMEGNTTFTLSTSAEIKPALKDLLDNLQKTPLGKISEGISMASGLAAGVADANSADAFVNSLGLPPNVRYQTELSLLPAWNGQSEVKLESLTFNFTMGMTGAWDARTEVYNPVVALAAANLPVRNGAALKGPLPTPEYILGTVIKSLATSAGGAGGAFNVERAVSSVLRNAEDAALSALYNGSWSGIWAASLGRIRLPDFYVVNTSHSFSTETDEHGFPISGKVVWSEIKSIKMAHRGLPMYRLYGPEASPVPTPSDTSEVKE
jgi:hypothetical protein